MMYGKKGYLAWQQHDHKYKKRCSIVVSRFTSFFSDGWFQGFDIFFNFRSLLCGTKTSFLATAFMTECERGLSVERRWPDSWENLAWKKRDWTWARQAFLTLSHSELQPLFSSRVQFPDGPFFPFFFQPCPSNFTSRHKEFKLWIKFWLKLANAKKTACCHWVSNLVRRKLHVGCISTWELDLNFDIINLRYPHTLWQCFLIKTLRC